MNMLHRIVLLNKIKVLHLDSGELINDYEKAFEKNKCRGSVFLSSLVIFFCLTDGLNYYSSFNSIYMEDFFVIFIISVTLTTLLNYSNTVIVRFLTTCDESIEKSKKKILWIGTFAVLMVIASLLVMLYLLRFSIIDVLFDGVSLPAAQSMTLIWSSIAVGTTVCSFTFASINNLVIIPFNEKLMKRGYLKLARYLLTKKETLKNELEMKIQLYRNEHDTLERIHKKNLDLIKAEADLIYQMYTATDVNGISNEGDSSEMELIFPRKIV